MRLLKFQAASLKDAIAKVKADLGPDAMVVATRDVKRGLLGTGVEVTAAIDDVDMGFDGPGADVPSPRPKDLSALSDRDVERIMTPLRSELRTIRTELAPISAAEAQKIRTELSALRHALVSMRPFAPGVRNDAHQEALAEIAKRSAIARAPEKRILALVGPTGAGKTTTFAKLAAKAALERNQTVALVSVDTYRVGGE
jgi:flagellar biosynthesis protein FlhF